MAKLKTEKSPEEQKTEFQTPPHIAAYMASLIPHEAIYILEPTPGVGNLVAAIHKQMKKRGKKPMTAVSGNYLLDHPIDYFLMRSLLINSATKRCVTIMNPPFSKGTAIMDHAPENWKSLKGLALGYQFLIDAMQMSDCVICLLPWFVVADSDVRLRQIMNFGLKSITALPRATFKYARIQTVVLVLEKGYKGETVFKSYDILVENSKHVNGKLL